MMPSLLIIFNPHSYGGSELLCMRTCLYFASKGWRVSVEGANVEKFFYEYGDRSLVDRIDFSPGRHFDYFMCPGIAINMVLELAGRGVSADRCVVWALGEAGLLENLAYGYGARFKFRGYGQLFVKGAYKLILGFHFQSAQKFVNELILRGGLYFTEGGGLAEATGDPVCLARGDDLLIPIPVPSRTKALVHFKNDIASYDRKTVLRLGWIGRISSDFKIYPLITTIRRAVEYCDRRGYLLKFIVIGDGDALPLLKSYVATLAPERHLIRLEGFVPSEKAAILMAEEADLMIGMGTAALDAANVGLPSIIVSAAQSFPASELCRYRWLYDSKGFSNGEFVELGNDRLQIGSDFGDIIDKYLVGQEEVRNKCIDYVKYFHEDAVFEKLKQRLSASEVSLANIETGLSSLDKYNAVLKKIVNLIKRVKRITAVRCGNTDMPVLPTK